MVGGVSDIASSLQTQSAANGDIAVQVEKVAQMAEQNTASIMRVDDTAKTLESLSGGLKALTAMFTGGWLSPIPYAPFTWVPGAVWFILKLSFYFFMIAMAKAIVPRYRYDQLMRLGWKVFLPISLVYVLIVAFVLHFTHWGAGA